MAIKLKELLLIDNDCTQVDGELLVLAITADSREVRDGTLFVAVTGLTVDGHNFVDDAIDRGCVAVIVTQGRFDLQNYQKQDVVPIIEVRESSVALGRLAVAFYGYPARSMQMIGITGTNGKTTTSWLVEGIIREAGGNPAVIGTVNYRYNDIEVAAAFTTPDPLTLQKLLRGMADGGITHVVMEVSSHSLALHRVEGMLFDLAIFTNLSREHLDFHGDMVSYFNCKKKLFLDYLKESGKVVVVTSPALPVGAEPGDEKCIDWSQRLVDELCCSEKWQKSAKGHSDIITCGMQSAADIAVNSFQEDLSGISAEISSPAGPFVLRSSLVGEFNLRNLLGGVGGGLALGFAQDVIARGLARVKSVPGRLERVTINGSSPMPTIFVDYAHTPDALENVLKTLRKLFVAGRLIALFGCGGDRDQGKRPLMGEIAGKLADIVLLTSDNPRSEDPENILVSVESGVRNSGLPRIWIETLLKSAGGRGYDLIVSRRQAIALAVRYSRSEDIILISGKGHENYLLTSPSPLLFDDRVAVRQQLVIREKSARGEEVSDLNSDSSPCPLAFDLWSLEQLLAAVSGRLLAGSNGAAVFRGICIDSRSVRPGDIFIALSGNRYDGHDYLAEAVVNGACGVIVSKQPVAVDSVPVILVNDTLKALGDLAAYRRMARPDLLVLALTGSSGKTTVKEMVATILAQKINVLKTSGNFNNLVGLPLSLLPVTSSHDLAVLEMGMNRFGEIARMVEIAAPDIVCITNIQEAHLEGVGGTLEGVAKAKGEIFAGLKSSGKLIVNIDDERVKKQADQYDQEKTTFGCTAQAWVRATDIRTLDEEGISFTLHIGHDQRSEVKISTLGLHNVMNALAAAAMTYTAGMNIVEIAAGLARFEPYDKRLKVQTLANGLKLINDSYNANPASMRAALQILRDMKRNHRAVAVLGDMLELGEQSEDLHLSIGKAAGSLGLDYLLVIGTYADYVVNGAKAAGMSSARIVKFVDKAELGDWLKAGIDNKMLAAGDWILLKGSRGMQMETVVSF